MEPGPGLKRIKKHNQPVSASVCVVAVLSVRLFVYLLNDFLGHVSLLELEIEWLLALSLSLGIMKRFQETKQTNLLLS